ncbi:unnamed protein product [Moneuplotes crassus]|uniref:PHR domain-containing protein n=1 Tax=Euplotes crassus TaxID=5936 RepID=A0AAD1XI95_EUPCR|nr:unnamed protein product [Moneuplotes crassus]
MEKFSKPSKYSRSKDLIWRITMDENNLAFTSLKPSLKELTQEEMKNTETQDQFNFCEDGIFRSFKTGTLPVFNKAKLVYNSTTHTWYKVLDLKTDDDGTPIWANLAIRDGSETTEISCKHEFDQFKNSIKVLININFANSESIIIEVNPKIYDKLEAALEGPFQGVEASIQSYRLFYKGRELNIDESLANIDHIYDGATILATEGTSTPSKFCRFPPINEMRSNWSNSGRGADAIIFIPNQNIRLCGFSTFAATTDHQYEMKYIVKINGIIVEQDQVTASGWEDKYYHRYTLQDTYPVQLGQDISLTVWIAKDISSHQYVSTYAGSNGNDYTTIDNEHMGLFTIKSTKESRNGTSVSSGHFPEIFYHLS